MKVLTQTLLIAASLCLTPVLAQAEETPKFAEYPVDESYSGSAAKVVLDTEEKRMYRSRLRDSRDYPVDFAGEYSMVTWGCGTSCVMGAVVSKKTGKVVWLPGTICCWDGEDEETEYVMYRENSRLLVTAGVMNEEGEHGAHFYKFTGKSFKHLLTVPVPTRWD